MAGKALADAVSAYGAAAKAKLSNIAISGAPEDQLRGPLEALIKNLAAIEGMSANAVELVGETTLSELKTRPDFAVTVSKTLVGFIEIKAPGKGADPRKFSDPHDREQWDKLKSLPNLIYTDGKAFSLWRDGKLESAIVSLEGDVESAGAKLAAPSTLLPLVSDFLRWAPIAPKGAKQLAQISARLCRLLRDEVIEQMALGSRGLTGLAQDWRALLFPQADDAQFADGYAQAVTFGLLVARARDIPLSGGTEMAAQELKKSNSLIGTALRLLTEDPSNQDALKTSLGTLTRVLDAVNWHTISKDKLVGWVERSETRQLRENDRTMGFARAQPILRAGAEARRSHRTYLQRSLVERRRTPQRRRAYARGRQTSGERQEQKQSLTRCGGLRGQLQRLARANRQLASWSARFTLES